MDTFGKKIIIKITNFNISTEKFEIKAEDKANYSIYEEKMHKI